MDQSGDFFTSLSQAFTDFRAGWFLGSATLCYLIINMLRGKAGFSVPIITPWLEKQPKELKTYVIYGFFALAGLFKSFSVEHVTFGVVCNGFLQGLTLGLLTNGVRNGVKQGIEGAQALRNKNKEEAPVEEDKTDQNGSNT
jgi:hypothetical protein